MNPKISVMMATYEQSEYLMDAINSIMSQSVRPKLFVSFVTYDRRTARAILGSEYNENIHYSGCQHADVWKQAQDALCCLESEAKSYRLEVDGVTYFGIGPFKDGFTCRFDSDDIMVPGWLEKAVPIANKILSRGKVPIVCPSFRMVDKDLKPISDVILPEFSMDRMLEGSIIPEYAITTIGALRGVGGYFPDDYPDVPDRYRWYAMMLRVLKANDCEVVQLPDIGFLYRQHKGQDHAKYSSKWRSRRNVKMLKLVAEHYFPKGGRA